MWVNYLRGPWLSTLLDVCSAESHRVTHSLAYTALEILLESCRSASWEVAETSKVRMSFSNYTRS